VLYYVDMHVLSKKKGKAELLSRKYLLSTSNPTSLKIREFRIKSPWPKCQNEQVRLRYEKGRTS
jgi:hypothetical protein